MSLRVAKCCLHEKKLMFKKKGGGSCPQVPVRQTIKIYTQYFCGCETRNTGMFPSSQARSDNSIKTEKCYWIGEMQTSIFKGFGFYLENYINVLENINNYS